MKTIIIVCWYSPGSKNVGYRRALYFANYFADNGWDVYYVTANYPDCNSNEVINKKINFISINKSYRRQNSKNHESFLFSKLKGFIRRNVYAQILDPRNYKLIKFLIICRELNFLRKNNPLIFATSPPIASLILGVIMKFKLDATLAVDYRDLFAGSHLFSKSLYFIEKIVQNMINKYADYVFTVSDTWRVCIGENVILLRNGFDREKFKLNNQSSIVDCMVIRYFGSINHPDRIPVHFVDNIAHLSHKYKIEFYGDCKMLEEKISKYINTNNVSFYEYVNYDQAIDLMNRSYINLLIGFDDKDDSRKGMIQTKCYEYMAARRPILYFGSSSCTTHNVVAPSNLLVSYDNFIRGDWSLQNINDDYINSFDREHVSKSLMEILDAKI